METLLLFATAALLSHRALSLRGPREDTRAVLLGERAPSRGLALASLARLQREGGGGARRKGRQQQGQALVRMGRVEQQREAVRHFFGGTGARDMRVLRSGMYLSDEVDRALRGVDLPGQYVGWRPYNRFYAAGTEELFTNVPTGRSPLVLAEPKSAGAGLRDAREQQLRAVQFQAMRQSARRQISRTLQVREQQERERLQQQRQRNGDGGEGEESEEGGPRESASVPHELAALRGRSVRPANRDEGEVGAVRKARDLQAAAFQRTDSLKRQLLRFEGDLQDRRPDLDYRAEDYSEAATLA